MRWRRAAFWRCLPTSLASTWSVCCCGRACAAVRWPTPRWHRPASTGSCWWTTPRAIDRRTIRIWRNARFRPNRADWLCRGWRCRATGWCTRCWCWRPDATGYCGRSYASIRCGANANPGGTGRTTGPRWWPERCAIPGRRRYRACPFWSPTWPIGKRIASVPCQSLAVSLQKLIRLTRTSAWSPRSRSISLSLYNSSMEHDTRTSNCVWWSMANWKMRSNVRGASPGWVSSPMMVCVLPLPVCPYAQMHTL